MRGTNRKRIAGLLRERLDREPTAGEIRYVKRGIKFGRRYQHLKGTDEHRPT